MSEQTDPVADLIALIKDSPSPEEAAQSILKHGYRNVKDLLAYVVHCKESDTETLETEHWIKGVFLDEELAYKFHEELMGLDKYFSDVACDPVHLSVDEKLSGPVN